MTSQPGYQRITMHILLNISRIKCNPIMKFGLLIEYPKINEAGKLVPDRFLFSKKSFILGKSNFLKLYAADPELYSIFII